ncbi:hypothetical protein [Haladaptatus sp. DJG-WS-42]|uniref:hypothetical protein n=1 Tax=Haladaptatus sp. DJG-WS-42 TaxID=3120516 RepID=UPI0030CEA66B
MHVTIEACATAHGVQIADPIERRQCALTSDSAVTPRPVDTDRFTFPVDTAVAITTSELVLPQVVATYIRTDDGDMVVHAEHFAFHELPKGTYSIELNGPIKLYIRVKAPFSVTAGATEMTFEFDAETEVLVGARSYHDNPATTITTTEDPHDMMAAISALSSALKTTSCERSYPTLRGHPPMIELGDELDIPDALSPPETGVTIELPPELGTLYVIAPLAYYLGANVEPGPAARIVTETGYTHPLGTGETFEREVERLLKQTFFLDCLTRTEGYYQVSLHERSAVEDSIPFSFENRYSQSVGEQLKADLEVPFRHIEPHLPEWKLTTHISPTPENVEILPFLVNDLAVIRTPKASTVPQPEGQTAAVDEFLRDEFMRATTDGERSPISVVQPEPANSLEQAWVGDDAPLGATKATVAAYRNRLRRDVTGQDVDITVVCNDEAMLDEHHAAADVYGSREALPFNVTLTSDLSVSELAAILESDVDFVHYIGHIDDDGFQCTDGKLDVQTLDSVGVDAFLLNACRSYTQGMHLIEAGSVGGVVTLDDVIDSGAFRIGSAMARLLNRGFPLRAALTIASDQSIIGSKYLVVGDGNVDIAHAESLTPYLCDVRSRGDDYDVSIRTYPTSNMGIGTLFRPHIGDNEDQFLSSGHLKTFSVGREELIAFLSLEEAPVIFDGTFTWSSEIAAEF